MPAEPLSAPVGKTAELTCTYSTSVTDSFALEWSFVQPGKPISASAPVSWGWGGQGAALASGWVRPGEAGTGNPPRLRAGRVRWGISVLGREKKWTLSRSF